MGSGNTREEEALLAAGRSPPRNRARDAHILSFAFWLVFLSYHAVQNLESSVNTVRNLVRELCFFVFNFVLSVVRTEFEGR